MITSTHWQRATAHCGCAFSSESGPVTSHSSSYSFSSSSLSSSFFFSFSSSCSPYPPTPTFSILIMGLFVVSWRYALLLFFCMCHHFFVLTLSSGERKISTGPSLNVCLPWNESFQLETRDWGLCFPPAYFQRAQVPQKYHPKQCDPALLSWERCPQSLLCQTSSADDEDCLVSL